MRCLGREPEFAPIRIGRPTRCAARTTSATLSGPPMLPGLMRTAATPAAIAFRARLALKWMSAITGIGDSRTILRSASASSIFGTAQRTISHPADASAAICAVVASTSCVFVSVIDCTTTGEPPPMMTPPTEIWRSLAIATSLAPDATEVVGEPDEHQDEEQGDAQGGHEFVNLAPDGSTAQALDDRKEDMTAVQGE